jgi:transcriptional repressor NrdR
VIDSRDATGGIRRRRECCDCNLRFTTYERVQTSVLLMVKRDGRREEFNRDKLTSSIRVACAKRPLPPGAIVRVVDNLEENLHQLGRAEVATSTLGEMVVDRLAELDRVAYVRFASVYRDFEDIESFREEIDALLSAREASRRQAPANQLRLIPLDKITGQTRRYHGRKPRTQQRPIPIRKAQENQG